jgi:hypothetical protein
MRHYVLTRSAYGPAWDLAANRRRLAITRAVTAHLMAHQTTAEWAWIVLFDSRDPLLDQRMAVYRDASPAFTPLFWSAPASARTTLRLALRQRIAAADYQAPWQSAIGEADDMILTTRLDDDDGLAVDAIARYQAAAAGLTDRTALVLPMGIRVWYNRYSIVRHERNAMHTFVAPPGDTGYVYGYGHTKVAQHAPVVLVDEAPGWLWVRHIDTISGYRQAELPLTREVRAMIPADWAALDRAWHFR